MTIFTKDFSKKLRWALLVIMVMACGIILSVFLGSRNNTPQVTEPDNAISEKSALTIGKIQHTATRNGVTEWSLEAGSAEYQNENHTAILHDLSVTFFLEDNETAKLFADKGVLTTDTFDIEVSGNVMMKNKGYRIEAQKLSYRHDNKAITSDTPIHITGPDFSLSADHLSLDLYNNLTVLRGHVKGIFNETYAL